MEGPRQFGRRVSSRLLENRRRGKEVDEWQRLVVELSCQTNIGQILIVSRE